MPTTLKSTPSPTETLPISFMQAGLPDGLHLVDSCENARSQAVRVGPNAAEVSRSLHVAARVRRLHTRSTMV